MRPIKLIISAFGPYAKETIINLDDFGKSGIYLISGDTGAGKTMIFDAISYALFGEPSGNVRDVNSFRSKYATDDVKTYVELKFEYRDKIYKVRRNPEYFRPSKRGEGMVKEMAGAELILPDGRIVSKIKEVNKEITKILGINREQFCQIAMISQGEFLKLILADTRDREKIFRQILKTSYYQKLDDELKAVKNSLYGECNDLRKSIAQYKSDVELTSGDENLETIMEMDVDGEETLVYISKLISASIEEKNRSDKELKDLEDKILKLGKAIDKKHEYEKTNSEVKKLTLKLNQKEIRLDECNRNVERAKSKGKELDKLKYNLKNLESKLGDYQKARELELEIKSTLESIKSKKENLKNNSEKIELINKSISEAKSELEKLEGIDAKKLELVNKSSKISEKLEMLNKVLSNLSDLEKLGKEIDFARKEYKDISAKSKSLEADYRNSRDVYFDNMAGILARDLKEDEPCPVCGSIRHPELAKLSSDTVSKAELDRKEKACTTIRKDIERMIEKGTKLKAERDKINSSAEESLQKLNISKDEIQSYKNKIILSNDELEREKKNIDEALKKRDKLKLILPKYEKDLLELNKTVEKLKSELADLSSLEALKKHSLSGIKKDLEFENKDLAEKEIIKQVNEIKSIETLIKDSEKTLKDILADINELKGTLNTKKEQVEKDNLLDELSLDDLKEKSILYKSKKLDLLNKIEELSNSISSNKKAKEGISKKRDVLLKKEARYSMIKSLADTVCGNISGKDKITLETYVQMKYFDRIIERANIRFMNMSGGQYELKRSESSGNQRNRSGLDLNVIDHYNSSERSVKTLSGGESFKASLSLALGLSDEVQSMAGGIKIDTMFVDEGFGTLSEDSLNKAIQTLMSLSEENRLIGIISHVAQLKDKIDKKIVVSKNRDGGSSAEIRY